MNGAFRSTGRIVVTGGAGLIGSACLWELNRRGLDDVLVVDRLGRSEKWRHLTPLRFADYVETDDFSSRLAASADAFGPIRAVIHLGACSSTTERDVQYLVRNNHAFSQIVAEWALERGARLVYASSAATYGARERDLREDLDLHALRPLNAYGWSKLLFDQWAARSGVLDHAAGLKYFNVYGPNEDHKGEMRSVVAKAYETIVESGVVQLFRSYRHDIADGEQSRDFLYVKDAAAITVDLALERPAVGLINVGSGAARTWVDLARAIFAALGREPRIVFVDMPAGLRDRYQYRTEATIDRLRASGARASFTTLEAAVADYVRGYLVTGAPLDPADAPIVAADATPAIVHHA